MDLLELLDLAQMNFTQTEFKHSHINMLSNNVPNRKNDLVTLIINKSRGKIVYLNIITVTELVTQ